MKDERTATGGAVLRQRVTEAITEAAFAELAEVGYARTSMERVAKRAGVGKAALYRRWSSKQTMLTELIRDRITASLPPTPATGVLRTDLLALLTTIRGQLSAPLLTRIGAGLLAEAGTDAALAEMLESVVAAPRRAAALEVLRGAVDRGELPPGADLELGIDLVIAPLAFRVLVTREDGGDEYLERLADAIEAGLKATAR
ncbi:TetR/AcrR family transcriptional regulator [Lentzea sp. NPDC059081]|uniref:TetR/AcrR family transcriptional regulator n=1 Tax=Lentzea sp. NPDC059081 TaxID=3346719 RepID=UPI0036971777